MVRRLTIYALVALGIGLPSNADAETTYIFCPFVYFHYPTPPSDAEISSLRVKLVTSVFGSDKVYHWSSGAPKFMGERKYRLVPSKVTSDTIEFWYEAISLPTADNPDAANITIRHKINRLTGTHEEWSGGKEGSDEQGHRPRCRTETPKF